MNSDPNANYETSSRIKKLLVELDDQAYASEVAKAMAFFADLEEAVKDHTEWLDSNPRGVPSEILLKKVELPAAKQKLADLEARRLVLRGDFLEEPPSATQDAELTDAQLKMPTPLTTSDIAHSFTGMRWSEEKWKKPLGDRPKWLAACVVIPGSRGVSETRWNPVLIGAALVRDGHAKPNSVRAKFQTMPLLQPWLDAWKTYEADNFDSP